MGQASSQLGQLGPYSLLEQVAVGGMAEIYLAKTQGVAGFEKVLCLKIIHPNYADDDHFIDINRPVVSITNFGIAVKLLTQRGARAVFTVRSVVHRSSKRPLWRTGDIGRGEPLTLSGVVRAKARAEVDPLERALAVASGAVAKRRRVKGKQADESESAEDSEGSVSSEIVVHEQRRLAVKQSSFFYTEVGLKSVETVHPGLGKCRVCEAKIKKAEARCIWV